MNWDGNERIDIGEIDHSALTTIRTTAERVEPFIEHSEFDDPLHPTTLLLFTSEGIKTDSGRFDVGWTTKNYYRFHYTEGNAFNFRYDRHPHPNAPEKHYHCPPDCPDHVADPSCLDVEYIELVTIAVMQLWGDAVREEDPELLVQSNPP
jgi:hypothetical protein